MVSDNKFSMFNVSFRNYWSEDWNGLDVGHRGLGNSYTQVAAQKYSCGFLDISEALFYPGATLFPYKGEHIGKHAVCHRSWGRYGGV